MLAVGYEISGIRSCFNKDTLPQSGQYMEKVIFLWEGNLEQMYDNSLGESLVHTDMFAHNFACY
jgi:hypothetical protein